MASTLNNNIRRSSTHSIKPYLKCLQLNLQHSTKASSNKPTGFPSTFRLFSFGKGKSRAAVLVLNKSIDSMLISQLSDKDAVVVEVKTGDLNFIAASIYFDIRRNLDLDLLKIRKILDFAKGKGVLLAIDSNSRSRLWHDLVTNSRGKILEEFLIENQLSILNTDNLQPTFQTSRGSSKIDLTIFNDQLIKEARNWNSAQE